MKILLDTHRVALRATIVSVLTISMSACKLDVTNPNAGEQERVLTSVAGIRGLAIGMQGRLSNAMDENIYIPGVVSGELGTTSITQSTQREFQNFPVVSSNSPISDTNVDLLDIWAKNYGVVKTADDILNNIEGLSFAPGTKAGITGLAKLYKAWAYGFLVEAFQKISIDAGASFVDRPAALAEILKLLASAKSDVTSTTLTTDFTGTILSPNFDLLNTIRVFQARYSLAAGNYSDALAFANEVSPTASAVITYANSDINPFNNYYHQQKFYGAISSYRANAEAGDTRVNQFTRANVFSNTLGGASTNETNIFANDADPIPAWTQDEVTLIRAEALARLNRLPEAIDQINIVRNKAGLPSKTAATLSTQAAVLDEIFVQRTYSLFSMGLHWADERRLGKVSLAKVAWLPYPFTLRATNPATPANP